MKVKNFILAAVAVLAGFCLVSCNKDHHLESPHTDASVKVVGTYEGVMTLDGEEITNDVVVKIDHIDNDSTQAVTVNIASAAKSMDLNVTCNVAAAGDRFAILPAGSSADANRFVSMTLDGNELSIVAKLNSKFALSAGSSAKRYNFVCIKK